MGRCNFIGVYLQRMVNLIRTCPRADKDFLLTVYWPEVIGLWNSVHPSAISQMYFGMSSNRTSQLKMPGLGISTTGGGDFSLRFDLVNLLFELGVQRISFDSDRVLREHLYQTSKRVELCLYSL